MLTGCNYWASHAATKMWRNWDAKIVESDFIKLKELGFSLLRVFPLWDDFQPLEVARTVMNWPRELLFKGERLAAGSSGVDPVMLDRLETTLDIAQKHDMKVAVALITGWMSGMCYAPPAFADCGLQTDPLALRWELALVRAIVSRFKNHPALYAWSPGNETNCIEKLDNRQAAACWMHMIADAIRSIDREHPIYSGMHSLFPIPVRDIYPEGQVWTIQDNAECFDVLTTHPYPLFTPLAHMERPDEFRNVFHAAAESVYYGTIGGKPCIVEEFGTFGRCFMDGEVKDGYVRCSLLNCWTHGIGEFLWWCSSENSDKRFPPYSWIAFERELGIFDESGNPKQIAAVFSDFNDFMKKLPFRLPPAEYDAVCVITPDMDYWANAWGCFLLAEQAGFRVRFACVSEPLPESKLYIVPGIRNMDQLDYEELLKRAEQGARVVFSTKNTTLAPSVSFWGFEPEYWVQSEGLVTVSGQDFSFRMNRKDYCKIKPGESDVWAEVDGEPVIFEKKHGKGSLILSTLAIAEYAGSTRDTVNNPEEFQAWKLYRRFAEGFVKEKVARSCFPKCTVSCHPLDDGKIVVVAVNNSCTNMEQPVELAEGWQVEKIYRGEFDTLPHHDALVFTIIK